MRQGNRTGLVVSLVAGALLVAGCSAATDPDGTQVAPLVAQAPVDEQAPVETIDLECSDVTGEATETFTIERTESPDFSDVWNRETAFSSCAPSSAVDASTETEKAAATASGSDSVHSIYGLCGAANPEAIYVRSDWVATADVVPAIRGMLELCPGFPYASELQAAIDRAGS